MAITINSKKSDERLVISLSSINPVYPSLPRTMAHVESHTYHDSKQITNVFKIRHYDGATHIQEHDRLITFYNDGKGVFPKDLDLVNGNVVGLNSELIDDYEFLLNWKHNNKGEKTLFDIIAILAQSKDYKVDNFIINSDLKATGTVVSVTPGTGDFSKIDLKYFGLIE